MRSIARCRRCWPLIAVLLMLLNACGDTGHRVLEEVSEQVYSVEANANINVRNQDGAILVYGSDVNEVRVQSLKKAYSQERLNQIAIEVSVKPDAVSVTAKVPPRPKWTLRDHSGTVDCTLVVPATARISTLDMNAGEILLDGLHGRDVGARLGDGRIVARNCFTNLNLTMDRGTLTLAYDWWEPAKFSAHVTVGQGNAWVSLPTEARFHLLARTGQGKIANDFNSVPLATNSSTREMNIDQVINGGHSTTIRIGVEKGNIKIGEANP